MNKKLVLILIILLSSLSIYSQVGINTESPNPLTELDIKNLINGTDTIPKGVVVPRMTQRLRDQMDVTNKTIANGLFIYNIDEDCYNYYSREDSEWKSICGTLGKARFDLDCSAVQVLGNYVEGDELTGSHMLKLVVTVTKAGSYMINGTTTNGYFFTVSGTFLTTGTYTVYADGKGTPLKAGVNVVTLTKNGEEVNCATPVKVTVASAVALYSLNCSTTKVVGQYLKGQALRGANAIVIYVNVSKAGSYNITTPVVNGIQFSASGTFSVGTQTVILIGTGVPTVNIDFPITIIANTSEGNDKCSAIVPMTLPPMTYGIIGTNVWSWATAARLRALSNTGTGTDVSFGPNGTVKMVSFTQLWSVSNANSAVASLKGQVQPDIILYFAYAANPTTELSNALADYINKGGCVIYGSADNTASAVNLLMQGVFGMQTAQNQIAGTSTSDNDYSISNLPNDPIINGPFGNLSGRNWGEDNASAYSIIMTEIPPNSIQICTAYNPFGKPTVDPGYSIVWYNDSKNFVYFGDSTGAAVNLNGNDQWAHYPSSFSSSGLPQSKYYGPINGQMYVYNAALELNAVAWAIKKAAMSGINPH